MNYYQALALKALCWRYKICTSIASVERPALAMRALGLFFEGVLLMSWPMSLSLSILVRSCLLITLIKCCKSLSKSLRVVSKCHCVFRKSENFPSIARIVNAVQCHSLLLGHLKIVMIGVLNFQKCLQFHKASQFTSQECFPKRE